MIKHVDGNLCLPTGWEGISPAGLHYIGATAMWTHGTSMRFVVGTEFTCRELQRAMCGGLKG
jgi:hypothetical protein